MAGDTSFWSKKNAQQNAINIDGTRNMVKVSAAKGVETFIHTSSKSVWGRATGVISEGTPAHGKSSWINYERSKHLGEIEALKGVELGMKVVELAAEMAALSGAKVPRKAPTWVLKVFGRLSVMVAALTGKEPEVTPELAEVAASKGTTFRSDKAIRELGYQIQPMPVSVRDTYDWLVEEGLL